MSLEDETLMRPDLSDRLLEWAAGRFMDIAASGIRNLAPSSARVEDDDAEDETP